MDLVCSYLARECAREFGFVTVALSKMGRLLTDGTVQVCCSTSEKTEF